MVLLLWCVAERTSAKPVSSGKKDFFCRTKSERDDSKKAETRPCQEEILCPVAAILARAGRALQCPRQEVWCAAWCWRGACSLVRAAWERRCPGCDSQPSCRLPAHGGGCQHKAGFAGAENPPWDRQWGLGTFFIPFTE